MIDFYILDGHQPVKASWDEYCAWRYDHHLFRVAYDALDDGGFVSTVFLGHDHGFGHGPPVLFETMIFGGLHDQWQQRACTWEEAEAVHAEALALAARGGG